MNFDTKSLHGNSIEVKDPDRATQAMALRASGASWRSIHQETGLDHHTVGKLIERQSESFYQWRKRAAKRSREGGELALEKIHEKLTSDEKHDLKALTVAYGIISDKTLNYHGEANQVVEHRQSVSMDAAQAAIRKARETKQAQAIDV